MGSPSMEKGEVCSSLLQKGKDLCELRRHTFANTVDYKTLKRLVQKLFPSCRCKEVHKRHADAVKAAANVDEEHYATEDEGQSDVAMTTNHDDGSIVTEGEGHHDVAMTTVEKVRLCPGHERALPIERTVMELDVKEEGISTLMCYLELHSNGWLQNLSNVYASCKVQCYGGPRHLQMLTKKCPPVAVAVAKARKEGKNFSNSNQIEFPVVEISDAMGWDSGPVKKELKLLQWDFSGAGPKRTGVMIEFSELAYHFRSPGDLEVEELDDVLQFLHTRVQKQEKTELSQLSRLYQALKSVSHKNYWMCCDSLDKTRNDKLKTILNEYFDTQTVTETNTQPEILEEPSPQFNIDQLIGDIRQFYNLYGQEHSLSGRAIARIFHGIASPCYPATTWGRVRRFWRSHLNVDFNQLMKIATKELIGLR